MLLSSKNKKKRGNFPLFFLAPALISVTAVLVFPIAYALGLSFFEWNLMNEANRVFIFFKNYVSVFNDPQFWKSFLLQIGFIFIAIPIELIIGFFVSILMNRKFKGAGVLRSLLLLPVFILPVLSGLTWSFMLQPEYGTINYILSLLGFKQIAWLAYPGTAYTAVILQDIWRMWPFMFIILYAGISGMPKEFEEAATIDGAGFWQRVFYIIIPYLKPTIITAILLRTIDALRIFSEVYVMTGGGPGNSTLLLSLYINKQAFEYFNIGYASAMSIILIVVTLILTIILVRGNIEIDGDKA
ncbi:MULTISPECIES: carbohydrate ABC transporter permease [Marinitoga]|jgi:multiple sugar transport system permease protein|uniref:Sugar ABC transporter permease n=1 Tax=Marinitoga aeolica TaxID=2809031 RepID=A0ABY8PSK0_9BACT|nr:MULTISPECIES: sugar ABC transporter permease [Marinitoga]MBM7560002.1 multiple sugar transport system permease protein [Marinitoga litoralis]WGS65613.1 sugar ABC transporter permease [Marinitoga aeolica]